MAELPQGELIFLIVVGSVGMLVITGGFAFFIVIYQKRMLQEQQKQEKSDKEYQLKMVHAQLESQELERKRIAANLHDSLGSLLWGAKLHAAFLDRSLPFEGERKASYIEMMGTLDQAIVTVKQIAWELTPEAFYHTGLSQSIFSLCTRLNGKGIFVEFIEKGTCIIWNDDRALQVYRIVQELVTNSVKHADATELQVNIHWDDGLLLLVVNDDGKGFSLDGNRSGVGWWNITQRTQQLGAEIHIGKPPSGQGSSVLLKVPLHDEK